MSKIPIVMALFYRSFLSEEEVIAWADEQLLAEKEPFDQISVLSLKGPKYCSKLPSHDFPPARNFTFVEEFALRSKGFNVDSEKWKHGFLQWITRTCMGLDLSIPEVIFGYHLDHYFYECDDVAYADKYLEEQLAVLAPKNSHIAEEIWAAIA